MSTSKFNKTSLSFFDKTFNDASWTYFRSFYVGLQPLTSNVCSVIFSVKINEDLAKKSFKYQSCCTISSWDKLYSLFQNSFVSYLFAVGFHNIIIQNDNSLVVSVSSAQTFVERDANYWIKFRIFCQTVC